MTEQIPQASETSLVLSIQLSDNIERSRWEICKVIQCYQDLVNLVNDFPCQDTQKSNGRQPNYKRSASRIDSSSLNLQWKKEKDLYSEVKHSIFKMHTCQL